MVISDVAVNVDKKWRDGRGVRIPLKTWYEAVALLQHENLMLLHNVGAPNQQEFREQMRARFEAIMLVCFTALEEL